MTVEVFAIGGEHEIDLLDFAGVLPESDPLQSSKTVRMFRVSFAKLNAFQPVDLDPLNFVDFPALRSRFSRSPR